MQLYGVIGHPILHSRSPDLFRQAFAAENRPADYLRLAARRFDRAIDLAQSLGLAGLNVTSPFKKDAAGGADSLAETAARLGVVNVLIRQNEKWRGDNSDVCGVLATLREGGFEPQGKRCVILGAGGAARAALLALRLGRASRLTVINRTWTKAQAVAGEFATEARAFSQLPAALAAADLLISCLPPGADPVVAEWLPAGLTVLEANYHQPLLSPKARARGCRTIDGRRWLVHQARDAYRLFFGAPPPEGAMTADWPPPPAAKPAIALIGFMGTGKSSLGRALAQRLSAPCFDLDESIGQHTGRAIAQIFAEQGEAEFRRIEKDILHGLPLAEPPVIACGGGVLLDEANRRFLQQHAVCVWCWSALPAILARTTDQTRPLLAVADREPVARRLLAERIPLYAAVADLVLDTEKQSIETAADLLADEIRSARNR
ncbi:MAG: hypothetical protein GX444_19665 [Myxococcales bacterium]|nr:hypothetical protein [Myxococcales bacterium]